jgi:hypothetical protein
MTRTRRPNAPRARAPTSRSPALANEFVMTWPRYDIHQQIEKLQCKRNELTARLTERVQILPPYHPNHRLLFFIRIRLSTGGWSWADLDFGKIGCECPDPVLAPFGFPGIGTGITHDQSASASITLRVVQDSMTVRTAAHFTGGGRFAAHCRNPYANPNPHLCTISSLALT